MTDIKTFDIPCDKSNKTDPVTFDMLDKYMRQLENEGYKMALHFIAGVMPNERNRRIVYMVKN